MYSFIWLMIEGLLKEFWSIWSVLSWKRTDLPSVLHHLLSNSLLWHIPWAYTKYEEQNHNLSICDRCQFNKWQILVHQVSSAHVRNHTIIPLVIDHLGLHCKQHHFPRDRALQSIWENCTRATISGESALIFLFYITECSYYSVVLWTF